MILTPGDIEVKHAGMADHIPIYDLVLRGRVLISDETFAVVDQIRESLLRRPGAAGECHEVARVIEDELDRAAAEADAAEDDN